MTERRWYWPRALWRYGEWTVWLAPTFGGFGVAVYPESPTTPRALSLGIWPITVTCRLSQLDGGDA